MAHLEDREAQRGDSTLVGSRERVSSSVQRGLRDGFEIGGRYRVGRLLGAGGMGLVYEAEHLSLGTRVAIKVLRPELADSDELRARLQHEARCLTALSSEHIVRVLDAGRIDTGLPFFVMERLVGRDLGTIIQTCGPLDPARAVRYALQLCAALGEAHGVGLVHCDVKPGNILLASRRVGPPRMKLLDFGIARWLDDAHSSSSSFGADGVMGSPRYSSPEQLESWASADERTDIWSLGLVLFEMLTGVHPFATGSMYAPGGATSGARRLSAREVRRELDPRLAAIVEVCLEPERDRRFGSMQELAEALEPFAAGHGEGSVLPAARSMPAAFESAPMS